MNFVSQPASAGKRILAWLYDFLILMVIGTFLGAITKSLQIKPDDPALMALRMLIMAGYFIGFHQSRYQATPGKMIMKICLVSTDAARITPLQATARYGVLYLGAILSLFYAIVIAQFPMNSAGDMKPSSEISTFRQAVNSLPSANSALDKAYEEIHRKIAHEEPLTEQERNLMDALSRRAATAGLADALTPNFGGWIEIIALLYSAVAAGAICLTQRHTGLHDLVCHTEVVTVPPGQVLNHG